MPIPRAGQAAAANASAVTRCQGLAARLGIAAIVSIVLSAATAPALASISAEEIARATYRIEGETERLRMRGGRWEGPPAAPGSATVPRAQVHTDLVARGDLDGDGAEEAVVLLEHDPGGSGRFLYVAVLTRREGRVVMAASRLVGDRVQVRSLALRGREIVLEVVRAGPSDAACCPGELATLAWTVQRRRLVPSASIAPAGRLSPAVLDGTRWALVQWAPGEAASLPRPIEIQFEGGRINGSAGCNRFFASFGAEGDAPGVVRVSPPGSTRMACEGEVMQAETRFLTALGAVGSFSYRMGRLVLTSGQGPGGLVFERR
jgi:heat shock protein HslJ